MIVCIEITNYISKVTLLPLTNIGNHLLQMIHVIALKQSNWLINTIRRVTKATRRLNISTRNI